MSTSTNPVAVVVADTSIWIEFFSGRHSLTFVRAFEDAVLVLPPIVVAELTSGAYRHRARILDLLRDLPLHQTPFDHWSRVGNLRRSLRARGLSVSTPDAHVAQCALDLDAVLLSRDRIFVRIASACGLQVAD